MYTNIKKGLKAAGKVMMTSDGYMKTGIANGARIGASALKMARKVAMPAKKESNLDTVKRIMKKKPMIKKAL